MDEEIYTPVDEALIPLFNGVVLGVRSTDGTLWLAVRDLAVTVDAVPRSQLRRVQSNSLLQRYVRWFRATTAGGSQKQLFLQLEGVDLWLTTISVWVGQRVAAARKAARLTVRQLADHLGWPDHSRLTSYETGRRAISVVTLMEIAQVLGQERGRRLAESPEGPRSLRRSRATASAQQLAYLFQLLGEDEPAPSDAPV